MEAEDKLHPGLVDKQHTSRFLPLAAEVLDYMCRFSHSAHFLVAAMTLVPLNKVMMCVKGYFQFAIHYCLFTVCRGFGAGQSPFPSLHHQEFSQLQHLPGKPPK